MWAVKIRAAEAVTRAILVHLLEEVLRVVWVIIELVGANLGYIGGAILFSEEFESKVLSEGKCRIVSRREHQSVQ